MLLKKSNLKKRDPIPTVQIL
ncbi:unnamed protein product, partial [Vitis vinifera]